jgi:hypothetical protein
MSNKKYKKCFCVEEVDETNNPNSDDIENVGIDESLLRIDDSKLKINDDDDGADEELTRRLAKLKGPYDGQGGYKRTKSKGEHLIRSHSYKSKKGGKRRTIKHNKKRKTVKHNKKRKTVKHNKKRTIKKKKFNKK